MIPAAGAAGYTESPMWLWLLIDLALAATALQILSVLLSGVEIDNWATAFIAAFLISVCGIPLYYLWWQAAPGALFHWQYLTLLLACNTISAGLVSLFLSGMRLKGVAAWIVTGIVLTVLDAGLQFLPAAPF